MDVKILKTKISMENVLEILNIYVASRALVGKEYRIDASRTITFLYEKDVIYSKAGIKVESSYGIHSIGINLQRDEDIVRWITKNENKYIKSRYAPGRNNINIEFFLMEDFEKFVYEILITKDV
ncbi:hypothetical protein D3C87_82400 [compost metagenome]